MTENISLSELPVGSKASITGLCVEDGMRRRLQDLGFVEGVEVDCVSRSPLGDPTAYRISSTIIALRREDADTIKVRITKCH
ncbi:MAG TPA: ferrous iron transport protein A [Clostridiaceae bacterium]|nr:ferrous iron transport protein A [Clostridiaceae bacterium]